MHIVESVRPEPEGVRSNAVGQDLSRNHLPQTGGVPQYSGLLLLPYDFGETAVKDSSESIHIFRGQRRRSIEADGRQLCRIPYHNQPAVVAGTHEIHEVLQEVPRPEDGSTLTSGIIDTYKRDFIHYEQLVRLLVRNQGELPETIRSYGFLPVYAFVYGARILPGIL